MCKTFGLIRFSHQTNENTERLCELNANVGNGWRNEYMPDKWYAAVPEHWRCKHEGTGG